MAAILVFFCFHADLALLASFKVKYSFEFYVWKKFAWKQKNTKMAAILE